MQELECGVIEKGMEQEWGSKTTNHYICACIVKCKNLNFVR